MTVNKENLRIKDFLFLNAINKETYKKMNRNQIQVFLRISLVITAIIAAFRGIYLSAFRVIVANPGEYIGSGVYHINTLTFNVLKAFEYAILEIVFLLILLYMYKSINRVTVNRNSPIMFDIALIAQLSLVKDGLFIVYSFLSLQNVPVFGETWEVRSYFRNIINVYDIGIFLPYILLLIIFFIPRIVTVGKQDSDYSKQIVSAFFVSMIIYLVSSFLLSVIKVLIDLPLGLF